jgi:hypothetical protein
MAVGNLAFFGIGDKPVHKFILGRFHGLFFTRAAANAHGHRKKGEVSVFPNHLIINHLCILLPSVLPGVKVVFNSKSTN